MKHWSCNACQNKKLTILMTDDKILFECDTCSDTRYVKRG